MNIEAAAKQIMSARHSDAFTQEACEKILRDAQVRELEKFSENQWLDDSPAGKAPNSPLVEAYLRLFAHDILHGDEVHRAWLLEAVECFIDGKHISEPRAKTPITQPKPES